MVFTEINPTSTSTSIDLYYDEEWTNSSHYVIGPFGHTQRRLNADARRGNNLK
jgi:hypothetical protein